MCTLPCLVAMVWLQWSGCNGLVAMVGVCGGLYPSLLVGVAPFSSKWYVLVLSESDEGEYVISNVLRTVLVLSSEHSRHVNEPFM